MTDRQWQGFLESHYSPEIVARKMARRRENRRLWKHTLKMVKAGDPELRAAFDRVGWTHLYQNSTAA